MIEGINRFCYLLLLLTHSLPSGYHDTTAGVSHFLKEQCNVLPELELSVLSHIFIRRKFVKNKRFSTGHILFRTSLHRKLHQH